MQSAELLTFLEQKRALFLTGGAGVGKTTLTRGLIALLERDAKKVARLASTGMAATLLGGQTLHSFFDLGICDNLEALERQGKLPLSKKLHKLIASMECIIIDEISMVSAEVLEMIRYRLLQAGFSGMILAVGDFLQLPPVVRGGSVRFAFESESWGRFGFETITLRTVYRTSDEAFVRLLDAVRFCRIDQEEEAFLDRLVAPLPEDLRTYTLLFGRNDSARAHNEAQLELIDAPEVRYAAQVIRHEPTCKDAEIERFFDDARVERLLRLKVGAPVLFTRNAWNYYNGERAVVVKCEPNALHVCKENGSVIKVEATQTPKTLWKEVSEGGKKELREVALFTLVQLPLQLAFAITIHKSQGMSLLDLIVDTSEIFAPSQFYVGLSRAITPSRLILTPPPRAWSRLAFVHPKALEFVRLTCAPM